MPPFQRRANVGNVLFLINTYRNFLVPVPSRIPQVRNDSSVVLKRGTEVERRAIAFDKEIAEPSSRKPGDSEAE